MKLGADQLQRPAPLAARALCAQLWAEVVRQWPRLREPGDREALHDVRVAMRRLRSTMRLYRAELDDRAMRRVARQLRRVFRATNEARDAEVLVGAMRDALRKQQVRAPWLVVLAATVPAAQGDEAAREKGRGHGHGRRSASAAHDVDAAHAVDAARMAEDAGENLAEAWARGWRKLERRWADTGEFWAKVHADGTLASPSFGSAAAEVVTAQWRRLREASEALAAVASGTPEAAVGSAHAMETEDAGRHALGGKVSRAARNASDLASETVRATDIHVTDAARPASAHAAHDAEALHELRILGKQLRYALEPLPVADAKPALKALKRLQDAVGEHRDIAARLQWLVGVQEKLSAEASALQLEASLAARATQATARAKTVASGRQVAAPMLAQKPNRAKNQPTARALTQAMARVAARRAVVQQLMRATRSELRKAQRHLDAALTPAHWAELETLVMRVVAELRAAEAPSELEIERKYLLKQLPARVRALAKAASTMAASTAAGGRAHAAAASSRVAGSPAVPGAAQDTPVLLDVWELRQGYLPGKRIVDRVREIVTRDGKKSWIRTLKTKGTLARVEIEEPIDEALFTALWAATSGRRVVKRRYVVQAGAHTWELDEFLDRTLFLAEVELPTVDTEVEVPAWLEADIRREVTDEPEFTNAALAR